VLHLIAAGEQSGLAIVHLPSGWTVHTGGVERIAIEAARVDEMLRALSDRFPELASFLEQVAIAIDGTVYHHARYEPLNADSEVHLLPPVAGG
jgi:molybdopterin converting factor small subunit